MKGSFWTRHFRRLSRHESEVFVKKNVIFGKTKTLQLSRETLLKLETNDLRIVGGVEEAPAPPSVKFCTDSACTTTTGG